MWLGDSSQPVSIDSPENIVDAEAKLVAFLSVKNLSATKIEMTLMLTHKSLVQDIRRIVDEVKKFYPDHV